MIVHLLLEHGMEGRIDLQECRYLMLVIYYLPQPDDDVVIFWVFKFYKKQSVLWIFPHVFKLICKLVVRYSNNIFLLTSSRLLILNNTKNQRFNQRFKIS